MGDRDGEVFGFDPLDAPHMALRRRHDLQVRRTWWWGFVGSPARAEAIRLRLNGFIRVPTN
ncbi:hypothetical protein HanPI659440_Chr11g0422781 [Helianthus annuus]|nr:hypothetical protein HanPI659440_Chr11g0422781 [Helianthus annuus]